MRASIDSCHDLAAKSGARIVHACGFDSIPSDLGVLLLAQEAGQLGDTTLLVRQLRGGLSGGTLASMRAQMDVLSGNPEARATVSDPYSLSPDRSAEPDLGDESDLTGVVHDPEYGWLAPFVMASANSRVVRRSNALAGYPYSKAFRYREAMGFGEGITARAKALGMASGLGALGLAMGFGPTRAGIGRVIPKPGEGPSDEDRAAGHFRMDIHAVAPDGSHLVSTVAAQGDPGYASTSLMLAESVLLAASEDPQLPDRAGVLTPATGLGLPLVERLRAAGMTFEAGPWQADDEAMGSGGPDDDAAGGGDPDDASATSASDLGEGMVGDDPN